MFQRRNPLTKIQSIRQALWPRMGWWRLVKYYRLRIINLSAPAESIAVNLAGGSAMSFTPFFGFHVLTAMGFAWLIRARMNVVAAMVGTFLGNPWTFPFLLYTSYSVGALILGVFDAYESNGLELSPDIVEEHGENILPYLWNNFTSIFVPTAVGGTVMAVITYPFFYILYFYLVQGAQRARKLRIKRKQKKLFNSKSKGE